MSVNLQGRRFKEVSRKQSEIEDGTRKLDLRTTKMEVFNSFDEYYCFPPPKKLHKRK